jgi:hypothetical protein
VPSFNSVRAPFSSIPVGEVGIFLPRFCSFLLSLLHSKVSTIGQSAIRIGSSIWLIAWIGNAMPYDSHQRAAEFHELAAHAHRAAAVHHGKEDHLTGHELSKQALEHACKALQWSQEAHKKSAKSMEKSKNA